MRRGVHKRLRGWIVVAALLVCAGCDLAAIPADGALDAGGADAAPDGGVDRICAPGERTCAIGAINECNAEGTAYDFVGYCRAGHYCARGNCLAIPSHCPDDAQSGPTTFSVSTDALVFDVTDDLKSRTASLTLENCTDLDIYLVSTNVRSVRREGRRPVFSLEDESLFDEGLTLPARSQLPIAVRYDPQFAYSLDQGSLTIGISEAGGYRHVEIPLIPRTHCLSATSQIDVGATERPVTQNLYVHNCGTVPMRLTDLDVVGEPDQPARVSVGHDPSPDAPGDPPAEAVVLAAGEFFKVPVRVELDGLGRFDHRVEATAEALTSTAGDRLTRTATTTVGGHAVEADCLELTVPPPRVILGQDWQQSWAAAVLAGQAFQFAVDLPAEMDEAKTRALVRLEPPRGSRAELRTAEPAILERSFTFHTDVVGDYRVEVDLVDAQGRSLCRPPHLNVEAGAPQGLHVELDWTTTNDLIGDDVGFGRGADLNLHVVPAAADAAPSWTDERHDCFGLGEYPSPERMRAPAVSGCAADDGQVASLSVSGAHAELVAYPEPTAAQYYLAVHAWSMNGFPKANASLRVYYDGQLVDTVVVDPGLWDDNPPQASLDLLDRPLRTTDQVWIFGTFDRQAGQLAAWPVRQHVGFPPPSEP